MARKTAEDIYFRPVIEEYEAQEAAQNRSRNPAVKTRFSFRIKSVCVGAG